MSKKFQPKPSWKNQYSEHDYRSTGGERRVSFKTSKYKKNNKGNVKDWSSSIRAHLYDEDIDIDMGASGPSKSNNRYIKKGNRSGSPAPKHSKRKLWEGPTSWYRVTLPFGNKYDKQLVQQTLSEKLSPLPFWPISWKNNGNISTFYVDDYKIAEQLYSLDRTIPMPDGFKMIIKVHYGSPNVNITTELKEKMKLAMANRYNAANKALDLTKFHSDPMLQDYFCALYKPIILLAVIDIIAENIPDLEALNLNDNKIQILTFLQKFVAKLDKVKILYLGQNKIRDIGMLDSLKGLPLIELFLDGNPLCDKFKDKSIYISEVRSRFPKVMKLDGLDLPPPIGFDLADEVALPTPLQTFLCDSNAESIIRQFLAQYFTIFDSENRQMLIQAYHEQATFSMTMAYPYGTKDKTVNWLNWYNTDNRNLIKLTDPERRFKLLKQGNVSIVSFLKEMPSTSHDLMNFHVDLTVCNPLMMSFKVAGPFKELKGTHKNAPVRWFSRTFVIVPVGTGFCISNELLHVSNATEEQIKAFLSAPSVPAVVPAPVANIPPSVVASPTLGAPPVVVTSPLVPLTNSIDDSTKQQMLQALMLHSGMNLAWSTKCLQETEWNFDKATAVFNEVRNQGKIPPEAFVKNENI
ncbi:nuclear RNA export factor 1-like isoform X2 [Harmonia axyridis]|uniref:nuclear RNA export factor 1-like isoform X2 n=1 Tax=Harmonia axyridis TaxID=115357 RepID=UPI001E279AF4|nr:nuclear RNA export factor 1-like isoform X2 [Harmonia axyridis]